MYIYIYIYTYICIHIVHLDRLKGGSAPTVLYPPSPAIRALRCAMDAARAVGSAAKRKPEGTKRATSANVQLTVPAEGPACGLDFARHSSHVHRSRTFGAA